MLGGSGLENPDDAANEDIFMFVYNNALLSYNSYIESLFKNNQSSRNNGHLQDFNNDRILGTIHLQWSSITHLIGLNQSETSQQINNRINPGPTIRDNLTLSGNPIVSHPIQNLNGILQEVFQHCKEANGPAYCRYPETPNQRQ